MANPVRAQVALSAQTPLGAVLFDVSLFKSTHIGAFDTYVGPEVNAFLRGGRNGGSAQSGTITGTSGGTGTLPRKRPSLFRILLPGGRLPGDLQWRYQSRAGFHASLSLHNDWIAWPQGGTTRLTVFMLHDFNRARVTAPTGIGILIDPTTALVKTNVLGIGGEIAVPLLRMETQAASHEWHVGAGLMRYRTNTLAQAQSAFLNLAQTERRERTTRTLSLTYTYRREPAGEARGTPRWAGLIAGLQFFETDHFWTAGGRVSSIVEF